MQVNGNILTADDGYVLTNGTDCSSVGGTIYLGINDKAENWTEMTESAYIAAMAAKHSYTEQRAQDLAQIEEATSIDQFYNEQSTNAQSGIAVAQGIGEAVGDLNGALATVLEGSKAMPQSILERLTGQAGAEVVERLRPFVEASITSKFNSIKDSIVGGTDRVFRTSVQVCETGSLSLEENTIYGIIMTGTLLAPEPVEGEEAQPAPEAVCTVDVFDQTSGEAVSVIGKMMGVIVGNSGDTSTATADALVAGYRNLAISKGVYVGKSTELQGAISWNTTAIVVKIYPSGV